MVDYIVTLRGKVFIGNWSAQNHYADPSKGLSPTDCPDADKVHSKGLLEW